MPTTKILMCQINFPNSPNPIIEDHIAGIKVEKSFSFISIAHNSQTGKCLKNVHSCEF